MSILTIYFHKDFDGFVAAALFLRINEKSQLIGADSITLKPVDYDIKDQWLKTKLKKPNVVIDFLYHPNAEWWFDHHVSTFLSDKHKVGYCNSEKQFWDIGYSSCAALIKTNLQSQCSLFMGKDDYKKIVENFKEWISWSEIIDNAKYESPRQIIELSHPCLQINATLTSEVDDSYLQHLIMAAKLYSPQEVAATKIVKERIDTFIKQQTFYMEKFKKGFKTTAGKIVFYNYVENNIPFQRYLAYYYKPDAHYSIGLYNRGDNYAISIGKNPWIEFSAANLGELCKKFGGGGRNNVGSIIIADYNRAFDIVGVLCKTLSP